jgi:hypothetical protein
MVVKHIDIFFPLLDCYIAIFDTNAATKVDFKLLFLQQLHCELPDAILRQIPDCGHIPHLERPDSTIKLIVEFIQTEKKKLSRRVSQVSQVSS